MKNLRFEAKHSYFKSQQTFPKIEKVCAKFSLSFIKQKIKTVTLT